MGVEGLNSMNERTKILTAEIINGVFKDETFACYQSPKKDISRGRWEGGVRSMVKTGRERQPQKGARWTV